MGRNTSKKMKRAICQATLKSTKAPCTHPARFDGKWCGFHRRAPESDCPVCYETIESKCCVTTKCGHSFHKKCLDEWKNRANTCPMCRTELGSPPPPPPPVLVYRRTRTFDEYMLLELAELNRRMQLMIQARTF